MKMDKTAYEQWLTQEIERAEDLAAAISKGDYWDSASRLPDAEEMKQVAHDYTTRAVELRAMLSRFKARKD